MSEPMTEGATGIAPEINDICASKLVAMRGKDFENEEVRRRAAAWVAAQSGDRPSRERETR